jgi:hypothetical protein
MYRALTGTLPLIGENVLDTMSKHVLERPRELTIANPQVYVPYRLQQLVMRMLEKQAEDRPQTMDEIGEILKRMLPKTSISMNTAAQSMAFSPPVATTPAPRQVTAKADTVTKSTAPASSFRLTSNLHLLRWAYVPLFLISTFAPYCIYMQFHSSHAKGTGSHLTFKHLKSTNRTQGENNSADGAAADASPSATTGADSSGSEVGGTAPATDVNLGTTDTTQTSATTSGAGADSSDTTSTVEADAAYAQAQEARQANDLPRAISLLNKASALIGPNNNAKHVVLLVETGDCFTLQGNTAEARPYYTEALKLCPPDSDLYRATSNRLASNQQ